MQRYIPIDTIHGEFISLHRLFSFKARIYGVVGARDYGKTFACKRKCFKSFKYKKRRFVLVRDTQTACEEVLKEEGFKLCGDIFSKCPAFKNDTYSVENSIVRMNGEIACEVMPLSAYYKYKGNYYDVEWVFFDEFIPEDVQAYRGNRARQFANTIETIVRDTKARVIMTANALDLGNDILELLDIHIKNGKYGYYINDEKETIVFYAPNSPEFEKRKRKSLSGKITRGTFLDASMNENKFESVGCSIFERRKPCDLFGIYYNAEGECIRLYQAKTGDVFYACKDINPKSYNYMRYVFNAKQVSSDRILVDNKVRAWLKTLLQKKEIQFESQYIFNVFCSIVNNTLKK